MSSHGFCSTTLSLLVCLLLLAVLNMMAGKTTVDTEVVVDAMLLFCISEFAILIQEAGKVLLGWHQSGQ